MKPGLICPDAVVQWGVSMTGLDVPQHPLLAAAARLSDLDLLARVTALSRDSRAVTVDLLAHLGELERRKLHRGQGCGKLFAYCTEILRFSEAAAWNRIKAARAARVFPVVLDMLADGRLNLTTIRLLAPYLTPDNHAALLREASGLSRRAAEKIVARLNPQADVRSSVRKLPARANAVSPGGGEGAESLDDGKTGAGTIGGEAPSVPGDATAAGSNAPASAPERREPSDGAPSSDAPPTRRGAVVPLRPSRYKLEVILGEEEHDDLRWLQDAMRREIADGDPAAIVSRALKALRAEVEKQRFRATRRPHASQPPAPGSRHIAAEVQRQVWARDGGRCAFMARNGRRCSETSYLEYHHADPYVIGGEPTAENISLRCRAHNEYESDLVFGPFVRKRVKDVGNSGGGSAKGAEAGGAMGSGDAGASVRWV